MTHGHTSSSVAVARLSRGELRLTRQTNQLASSFARWQATLIRCPQRWQADERLAISILLTMGICEPLDFQCIARSGEVFATEDGPMLAWIRADGQRNARHMSSLSLLAWNQHRDVQCAGNFVDVLCRALAKVDDSLATRDDPLLTATQASEAWCFLELPQFLFAHVCGDLRMTPLPRSAYARLESGYAAPDALQPAVLDEDASIEALQGYWQAAGDDSSDRALQKILESTHLRDTASKSDRALLQDLARTWQGHIDSAERAGPLTCLQLACALSLAADGLHKPRTILAYLKAGMPIAHLALAGIDLEAIDAEDISQRVENALQSVHGQTRTNASAYIGHLWRYARQWIDIEPLRPDLLPDLDAAPVDANIVWPHEVDLMDRWLNGPYPDPELAQQTGLVLRLLAALPVRVSEILFLQIRNIYALDGQEDVVVEIVRRGRERGLKTKDAQRVLRVSGALAAELLGHCNRRRIEHNGHGTHLLFATKTEPHKVYRLGAMYAWLNRAVKRATGDPTSCCHHFRHSSIDSRFTAMSVTDVEQGHLEQLRVDAGHADLRSTMRSYLHRYGKLLKSCIESSIEQANSLSSSTASAWNGQSSACLRQSRSRQRRRANAGSPLANRDELHSTVEWYWTRVHEAAAAVAVPPAADGTAPCSALAPAAHTAPLHWTVEDMINFLGDIENGASAEQARRQRRLPQQVADLAVEELLKLGQARMSETRGCLGLQLTEPAAALAVCGMRVVAARQVKYQIWLTHLTKSPPAPFLDTTWTAWWQSSRGEYIKLRFQCEQWLGYLLSSGSPAQSLLVCTDRNVQTVHEINRVVRRAIGMSGTSCTSIRIVHTRYNNRRGRAYLLVANAGDTLTDQTGAAFSVAGLKVIMLALRLASLASGRSGETAT